MENLIKPEFGLSFWTIVIFFLLVVILSKFVWRPLLKEIDEREQSIRKNIEESNRLREEAERYKREIEQKYIDINREADEIIKRVRYETDIEREKIIQKAQAQAEVIIENARKEIEDMKRKAEREIESKVVEISCEISKRVLHSIIDKKAEERILELTLKEHKEIKL
ncbi:MAG: F0F1 ATP synthase subunit B [Elusimicrobiales bacterium]